MPIFEYVCKDCRNAFETLVFGSRKAGAQKAQCPKCQSTKLEPQLSLFAVAAKGGGSTTAFSEGPTGSCGSCGDPRGAGACSINDLD